MSAVASGIDTVLFDLDGTLVDTEPSAARAVVEVFEGWGHPIDFSDAKYVTGRTWEKAFEFLFAKYPPPVAHAEAARIVMERYRKEIATRLDLVPGGVDCVNALADAGFRLGLVSGSNRQEIFFALDRLGITARFGIVLGAEDYPNSKPAPDGYLKAMAYFDAEPSRTLIFEDSEAGIASALAAGAWVVAISGTNHFAQDMGGAHHRVVDLRGVDAAWVRGLRFPGP
jgi:HAD superfamily hydrolase (TIGR01509 family)